MNNNKNFFLYILSQTISKIGSSILDFAIIWSLVLYNDTSTPFIISILITYIPKILIVYLLNKIKIKKKHKLMMNIGDAITAFFSFILIYVDITNLKLVYFIIFMRSIGSGIMEPYSNSIIVMLFDKESYFKKVNALNSLMNSMISLVIPAITAFILSSYSLNYIAIIDVVTAIISILIVSNLNVINDINVDDIKKEYTITLNNLLKRMLAINFIFYFFMTIPGFMTALLVKYYFGNNITYLKYNEIFWSLGMFIGSYIVIKAKFKNKYYYSNSIILFGLSILVLAFSTNIYLYLLVILISGISFPFYSTSNKLIIQKNFDKKENEFYFLKESVYINIATPLSMILVGYILKYIKINVIFCVSGLLIILLGLLCAIKFLKNNDIKL